MVYRSRKARPRAAGLTLLELLVGMVLSVVLLSALFGLYYGAARGAARDEGKATADQEARIVLSRLSRDFRMVGLMAPLDVDGDSNDISRDVPGQAWSDSLREDFEYAHTYDLVFTADFDDDGITETVRYYRDPETSTLQQMVWRWNRASLAWAGPVSRSVATSVDHIMFNYFDRNGDPIPNPVVYPVGGDTLSPGERRRVTAVEVTVVTRASRSENIRLFRLDLPDGTYWYDRIQRNVSRFMIRGRNLGLGA